MPSFNNPEEDIKLWQNLKDSKTFIRGACSKWNAPAYLYPRELIHKNGLEKDKKVIEADKKILQLAFKYTPAYIHEGDIGYEPEPNWWWYFLYQIHYGDYPLDLLPDHLKLLYKEHLKKLGEPSAHPPYIIEKDLSSTKESEQLYEQLEAELRALNLRELTEKIKSHLASDWQRMSKGKWDEKKERLLYHYKKNSTQLGVSSLTEYEKLTYEIIKNPNNVYVQKTLDPITQKIENDFIFVKERNVVISNDDYLFIKSCHKLYNKYKDFEEKIIEDAKKYITAAVRIL